MVTYREGTTVRCAVLDVFIVFKLDDFLDHGNTRTIDLPSRTLLTLGTIKGSRLGNCHAVSERHPSAPLKAHDGLQSEANPAYRIVFILNVVCFRVGIETLHRRQDPDPFSSERVTLSGDLLAPEQAAIYCVCAFRPKAGSTSVKLAGLRA
jgi:hypothetical protein